MAWCQDCSLDIYWLRLESNPFNLNWSLEYNRSSVANRRVGIAYLMVEHIWLSIFDKQEYQLPHNVEQPYHPALSAMHTAAFYGTSSHLRAFLARKGAVKQTGTRSYLMHLEAAHGLSNPLRRDRIISFNDFDKSWTDFLDEKSSCMLFEHLRPPQKLMVPPPQKNRSKQLYELRQNHNHPLFDMFT